MNFFFFRSEYYVNGCVAVFVFVVVVVVVFFFFFNYNYWDLGLMSLSAMKRRHPDFNEACNNARLLILNGLIM